MDFFALLNMPILTLLGYAVPFLAALTIIVFVHEYGHFKVARLCGVKIDTFSIGFGKEITGFYDKYGTRWKIGWVPLGGYVRFAGDANAASLPERRDASAPISRDEYHGKPVWQRALVVVAGPVANFILAIAIYTAAYMFVGVPASEPKVFEVLAGSAAEEAGLQKNDVIKSIDGSPIGSFMDIQDYVRTRAGDSITIVLDRGGKDVTVQVTPRSHEDVDQFGNPMRFGLLGISQDPDGVLVIEKKPLGEAFFKGVDKTWSFVTTILRYVGKLFTGRESTDQVGGIMSIAKAAGDAASLGLMSFLMIVGFLSISIGLINLFPIPMLDGGHLVYYAIEAARGKPLGPDAQEWGFRIGFALVMGLMLLGNWNDVMRFIKPWMTG